MKGLQPEKKCRAGVWEKRMLWKQVAAVMVCISLLCGLMGNITVAAEQAGKTEIEYQYDALGRVIKTVYPDGTVLTYTYDANGNLSEVEKTTEEGKKQESSKTEEEKTEDKKTEEQKTEEGKTEDKRTESGKTEERKTESQKPENPKPGDEKPPKDSETVKKRLPEWRHNIWTMSDSNAQHTVLEVYYTEKDIQNYSKFKKKKPTIKSLKCKVSGTKYSLQIRIKQVNKRGSYGELGYEIRYSESERFKKTKKVTVTRKKKGKYTAKSWNVKKGKTYYVKVRAYMETKRGKKIYTKYSKVKKIKAQK